MHQSYPRGRHHIRSGLYSPAKIILIFLVLFVIAAIVLILQMSPSSTTTSSSSSSSNRNSIINDFDSSSPNLNSNNINQQQQQHEDHHNHHEHEQAPLQFADHLKDSLPDEHKHDDGNTAPVSSTSGDSSSNDGKLLSPKEKRKKLLQDFVRNRHNPLLHHHMNHLEHLKNSKDIDEAVKMQEELMKDKKNDLEKQAIEAQNQHRAEKLKMKKLKESNAEAFLGGNNENNDLPPGGINVDHFNSKFNRRHSHLARDGDHLHHQHKVKNDGKIAVEDFINQLKNGDEAAAKKNNKGDAEHHHHNHHHHNEKNKGDGKEEEEKGKNKMMDVLKGKHKQMKEDKQEREKLKHHILDAFGKKKHQEHHNGNDDEEGHHHHHHHHQHHDDNIGSKKDE